MRRLPLVAVLVAIVAGACSPAVPPPTASPSAASASVAPAGGGGGTLVVAIGSDPGHLNPAITTSGATHTASELLFNGLVGLDENLKPIPELAESWTVEGDGAAYTFKLRDGVTWHDGTPFTSADVKFTFDEVLLKLHSRTRASVGPALSAIETPDAQTVVFRFKQPYAPLLQQLDVTEAPIVPKHIYERTDPAENPANAAPIGTGPFAFVSYAPDSEIRLKRNGSYWAPGRPTIDEIVMRVIPETGTQVIALERGEVDWIWGVPGPDEARLDADPEIELLRTDRNPGGANCIMTMSFNLDKPTLQDLRVRQAIAGAIDRQQIVDTILFGQGRVATAPISSGIAWAHADDIDLPAFDPAAAMALLEDAGWKAGADGRRTASGVKGVKDGSSLSLDFLHFPTFGRYAELLRSELGEIGIDLVLEPLEPPVFAETVFTKRDFDTNVISYCNGPDPEIGVRRMFDSAQIGKVPFSNAAGYSDPAVDALFRQAQQTVGLEARGEIYRTIQETVAAAQPYVWLVETSAVRGYRSRCTGFGAYAQFAEAATCTP
ncbi:MAG: ABC transporter substrate-binding protein [Chloroflexi bacterium]|nr:ABC transporter substrate-binding protein [Chloroflexota bacterium]